MKNLYIFAITILLLFANTSIAQNYAVGHKSITFVDPSRSDRQIDAEIYYPATSEGDNKPFVALSEGQFPALAFGHGFVMAWSAYENIWTNLVPQGFIMIFPRTESGISPSHEQFGKDLSFVLDRMAAENFLQSSFFYNRVAPLKAVMGHSMGGGAAFLAAGLSTNISAILTLAPAETNPSAIAAAGTLTIPGLIISGANDCVTPPAGNTVPMYNAMLSACKTWLSITGGSHCQMADTNLFCGIGEGTCSPSPAISRDAQHTIIDNYIGKWLKNNLKSDCVSGAAFDALIASDNAVTFQKNCLQCEDLAIASFSAKSNLAVPNPFQNEITFDLGNSEVKKVVLYDAIGKEVSSVKGIGKKSISTEKLSKGVYFYKTTEDGKQIGSGKLIKN